MYGLEIAGTIGVAFFTVIVALLIKLFWFNAIAPLWVGIIGTVVLGGTAIWACWKVGKFWYNKFKELKGRK